MTHKNKHTANSLLNEADKDILISKMLQCPGQLSDSEITQILEDYELRDIYGLSVELKAAKKSQIALDAGDEWERFQSMIDKTEKTDRSVKSSKYWINGIIFKRIKRVVAIFVGAFLVAGMIHVISNNNNGKLEPDNLIAQANETIPEEDDPNSIHQTTSTDNDNAQVCEDALKTKLNPNPKEEMVLNQDVKAKKTNKHESTATSSSSPKKNRPLVSKSNHPHIAQASTAVDIEEHLRVQRARMDNDLAMQRAEAVINQYYTIAEMTGEDPTLLTANLNYTVTDMENNELAALILP